MTDSRDSKSDTERDRIEPGPERPQRRDFLKGAGLAAGGIAAGAVAAPDAAKAQDASDPLALKNPYGGGPGTGVSLPDYYRPAPYFANNNIFYPGSEILPKNEMRVTFLGSTPWPPTIRQKGTSIMVELGNGTSNPRRFFFDLGNGSISHAVALQVPAQLINDIFISHLHVDHFADLPYFYPFRAQGGGYEPLRVYGPSGRTPELGVKHMIKHMREMARWHEENFNALPTGDGYEIEVTEFDWKDRNGICYDKDGVKVRHWPRSHVKDGASAYRLDWEDAGLSFVWTGDGRPDVLTAEYAKGADLFVTEGTIDTPLISSLKVGAPVEIWEHIIDIYHTMYYASGYLFQQAQPRMAAVCHFEWSGDQLAAESIAEIRTHWPGLFMFGFDLKVVNITKDNIWVRDAVISDDAAPASMDPRWFIPEGAPIPDEIVMPPAKLPRSQQQEQFIRDLEIDPALYYPKEVFRKPPLDWPGLTLNPREMLRARGIDPDNL